MPWQLEPEPNDTTTAQQPQQKGWTLEPTQEESGSKSALRTGLQLAKGAPYRLPYIGPALALHQTLNPSAIGAIQESLDELGEAQGAGYITPEQYEKAKAEILAAAPDIEAGAPTLGNLYRKVEEKTGLPLEARTPLQKGFETGSNIYALSNGSVPARAATGVGAGILKGEAENLGIPEEISDPLVTLGALSLNRSFTNPARTRQPTQKTALPPPPPNSATTPPKGPASPPPPPPEALLQTKPPSPPAEAVEEPLKPMGLHEIGTKIKSAILPELLPDLPEDVARPAPQTEQAQTPKHIHSANDLNNAIGNVVSNQEPESYERASRFLVNTLGDVSEEVHRDVGARYDQAERLDNGATAPAPTLARRIRDSIIEPLERQPHALLSRPERVLLADARSLVGRLVPPVPAELGGRPGELLWDSNQEYWPTISTHDLYASARRIRNQIRYDFEQANPTAVIQPIIDLVNDELEARARPSVQGLPEHAALTPNEAQFQAVRYANNFFRTVWRPRFRNSKIEPFLNGDRNVNLDKLWKLATTNIDTYKALEQALATSTNKGALSILKLARRELVQNHLQKYIKSPESIDSREIDYAKTMRDLSSILPGRDLQQVHRLIRRGRARILLNQRQITTEEEQRSRNKERQKASKEASEKAYKQIIEKREEAKKKYETILKAPEHKLAQKALNVAGYRELREKAKTQGREGDIAALNEALAHQTIYGGEEDGSPQKVIDAITNINKREILNELLGPDKVRHLLDHARKIQRICEILKEREGLLDKIKKPEKFTDKYNSWQKVVKEVKSGIKSPALFAGKVLKNYLDTSISAEETTAHNAEIKKATDALLDELECLQ